jgi:hypothetical protein
MIDIDANPEETELNLELQMGHRVSKPLEEILLAVTFLFHFNEHIHLLFAYFYPFSPVGFYKLMIQCQAFFVVLTWGFF